MRGCARDCIIRSFLPAGGRRTCFSPAVPPTTCRACTCVGLLTRMLLTAEPGRRPRSHSAPRFSVPRKNSPYSSIYSGATKNSAPPWYMYVPRAQGTYTTYSCSMPSPHTPPQRFPRAAPARRPCSSGVFPRDGVLAASGPATGFRGLRGGGSPDCTRRKPSVSKPDYLIVAPDQAEHHEGTCSAWILP